MHLVSPELFSLCFVQLILDLFAILSYSHFLLARGPMIDDGPKFIFLLIFIRQFIDEFVCIFQDVAVLKELIYTHIPICYYWIHFVVGFVVAVIGDQTSTTVLLKNVSFLVGSGFDMSCFVQHLLSVCIHHLLYLCLIPLRPQLAIPILNQLCPPEDILPELTKH